MNTARHKKTASDIFTSALNAVDPYRLVRFHAEKVRAVYQSMTAQRLLVIGFGKASVAMGKAVEDALIDIIDDGMLITKHGHNTGSPLRKLKVIEAGHPIPDEHGLAGTREILGLLHEADAHTLILCLISGGGSALLVHPCNGISLRDKQYTSDLLLRSGASISEINTVRKHVSGVKGGRLAELAGPARVMSLILSDVIGDRLDVIASGPTSPDNTTFSDALRVLEKYNLLEKAPQTVLRVIGNGIRGLVPETPKGGDPLFERVQNLVIGRNVIALDAARERAEELGCNAEIISSEMIGEARNAGMWLAEMALMQKKQHMPGRPCCLLSGGETTVTVKGTGKGGRNMELALSFAISIRGTGGITLLSAGTDGTDGPTDAAGAMVDGNTVERAKASGLDPVAYLDNNDSYNFFRRTDGLFVTGPTGTNVMDIQIIIVDP